MVSSVNRASSSPHVNHHNQKQEPPKQDSKPQDHKSEKKDHKSHPTGFYTRPETEKKEKKEKGDSKPSSDKPSSSSKPEGGSSNAGPVSYISPDGQLTLNPGDVLTLEMAQKIAEESGGAYVVKDGMLVNVNDPSDVKPIGQPLEEGDIHDLHHNVMGAGGGGNSLNPSGVPDPSKQAPPGEGPAAAAAANHGDH